MTKKKTVEEYNESFNELVDMQYLDVNVEDLKSEAELIQAFKGIMSVTGKQQVSDKLIRAWQGVSKDYQTLVQSFVPEKVVISPPIKKDKPVKRKVTPIKKVKRDVVTLKDTVKPFKPTLASRFPNKIYFRVRGNLGIRIKGGGFVSLKGKRKKSIGEA